MPVAIPERIGKYRVLRLLGAGGMGRVYLAVDPDIGREVAIKQVTLSADPLARQRFLREAQTMGRLNHPNIVTLLEFGVDAEAPFLVLELLSGEDGGTWMMRPHTLREQLQVMLDIARAIDTAHRADVLHRDLKPDNVRVLENGHCKLLDFGIALSNAGQLTASGYFVGTPEYVAPEVMSGDAHTPAADIYALGLLYYVLLSGDNPFRGDTAQATVARVIQRTPPSLRSLVLGVPVALAELIDACLSKDPQQRPPSAAAIVKVLEQSLAQAPEDARVARAPTRADTRAQSLPVTQATPQAAQPQTRRGRSLWIWPLIFALVAVLAYVMSQQMPYERRPVAGDGTAVDAAAQPDKDGQSAAISAPVEQTAIDADVQDPSDISTEGMRDDIPVPAPQERSSTQPADNVRASANPPQEAEAAPKSATQPAPSPPRPESNEIQSPATPLSGSEKPVPAAADTDAAAVPQQSAAMPSTPAAPAAIPASIEVAVSRVVPQVLKSGRTTTVRIEGVRLDAVHSVSIDAGGVPDARFRIGTLRHEGDNVLSFTLAVARGVPLGSYTLVLKGEGVHAAPQLLEISL
jgi:serine/threonine protein kinase